MVEESMKPSQCGEVRKISTSDNLFIVNNVIKDHKNKKKIYTFFLVTLKSASTNYISKTT